MRADKEVSASSIDRTFAIPTRLTIQVDTREKYPIPFPVNIRIEDPYHTGRHIVIPVTTERIKLDSGDYRLAEYPECCVVERKASQMELMKNLFDPADQVRTAKAFRRLGSCRYPVLLIEGSPAEYAVEKPGMINPEYLLHRLAIVVTKYRLNLMWVPRSSSSVSRRSLGMAILHLMLAHAMREIVPIPVPVKELEEEITEEDPKTLSEILNVEKIISENI